MRRLSLLPPTASEQNVLAYLRENFNRITDFLGIPFDATNIDTGVPTGAIDIGDAAAEGSSTELAGAGHQHQFSAPATGYPVDVAATEADGTDTTPARADHRHAHGSGYSADAHHAQSHNNTDHDVGEVTDIAEVGDVASAGSGNEVPHANHVHPLGDRSGFHAIRATSGQTLSTGTETTVLFNSEQYDNEAGYSTSTGIWTVGRSGLYLVTALVIFDANGTGRRDATMYLNGTTDIVAQDRKITSSASVNIPLVLSRWISLAATDTLRVRAFQNSGGDLDIVNDTAVHFAAFRLGDSF